MSTARDLSINKLNQVELSIKDLEAARSASINLIEDLTDEIEKRKLAEKELQISRQRLLLHFEQTPLAFVEFSIQGNIIEWNPSAQKIFGYSREEAIGQFMTLIVQESMWKQIDNLWYSIIQQKGGTRSSNQNITKDKRIIDCEWFNTPLIDQSGNTIGVASLIMDVTEQKRSADELIESANALRESEEKFRRIFEDGNFSICLADKNFRFINVNEAFCRFTGYSDKEILSLTFKDITHADNLESDIESGVKLYKGLIPFYQTEKRYIRKDGKPVWGSVNISAIRDSENRFLYFLAMIDDITSRKSTEQDLKDTQLILKATLESPVDMIILAIDLNYNYLSFNSVHKAVMKAAYGSDVRTGMNLLQCISVEEDILLAKENYLRAMKGESFITVQEFGDLERSYYETFYNPIKNETGEIVGATAFSRNITDRKRSELALKESEQKFRNLFEHSPVGKSMTSVDGTISVNKSFCRILGYTEKELKAKNWKEISHPDDIEMTDQIVKSLISGQMDSARFEKRYIHKNGSIIYTDVSTFLQRNNEGNPQFFVTTINDITERKNAEELTNKLNESLEQRVVERTLQLEAANKELEAFSYSVSHDLRAPLRAIHSYTNILREDYNDIIDDEGKRICGIIASSSVHMGQLIDDLLTFSRIGRTEISFTKIDMKKMVKTVQDEILSPQEKLQIKIKTEKLPSAYGDSATIKQVITNLLSNAIKYTSKSENPEILIASIQTKKDTVYYVKDNGVGFDMKYENKLFGVFQRLHSSKEFEGNGVGLAIVQRIIHRHGGKVWAESEVGKGATFFFTIPGKEAK